MTRAAWVAAIAAAAWMVPAAAGAQQGGNPNDPWCTHEGGQDRGHYCEVREMTGPTPGGVLTVNAQPNGGIKVLLPEGYSARLETSTVNGSVSTDFPVTVVGAIDRRHLTGDINSGGATLRLTTTNGGVSIRKK